MSEDSAMKRTDIPACIALLGTMALIVSVTSGFVAWSIGAVTLLTVATVWYWRKRVRPLRELNAHV